VLDFVNTVAGRDQNPRDRLDLGSEVRGLVAGMIECDEPVYRIEAQLAELADAPSS